MNVYIGTAFRSADWQQPIKIKVCLPCNPTTPLLSIVHTLARAVIPKYEHPSDSPGGTVRTQMAGTQLGVSDSAGLGCSLSACIANSFPSAAEAAGPETTLKTTVLAGLFYTYTRWMYNNVHCSVAGSSKQQKQKHTPRSNLKTHQ